MAKRGDARKMIRVLVVALFAGLSIFTGTILYTIKSTTPKLSFADTNFSLVETFDGANIDTGKWTIGGSAKSESGMLVLDTGSLRDKWQATGDFVAEVEMRDLANAGRAELNAVNTVGPYDDFGIVWSKSADGTGRVEFGKYGQQLIAVNVTANQQAIRVRMTRVDNVGQGFVDMGSGYQLVGTIAGVSINPYVIELAASGNAKFDSFTAQLILVGEPFATPTPTATPGPGEPNNCGGTCGSNYNCRGGLYCYKGFCRNPICKEDSRCLCVSPAPVSSPMPKIVTKPTPVVVDYPAYSPPPSAYTTPETIVPTLEPVDVEVRELGWWEKLVNWFRRLLKMS